MRWSRRTPRAVAPSTPGTERCVRATPNPFVQLTGTGACVGTEVLSNEDLLPLVHGYDVARSGPFGAWVDQVTHIHERPFAPVGSRTVDLALPAARQALATAGIEPKDLSLIIYATFTPSETLPGDHCRFAAELGAGRCPVITIMGACAGSIYGLGLAYGMVASRTARHVLVVAAETIRPMINWHDPLTAILFGDGAGAAVVSASEDGRPGTGMYPPHLAHEYSATAIGLGNSNNPHDLRCYSAKEDRPSHPLVERSLIVMNGGPSVLRAAVNNMADCVVRTLGHDLADLKSDLPELRETLDRAWLVPHQANGRIVESLADKMGMSKVMRTIFRYGNMSAASNLIALDFGIRHGNMEREMAPDGTVLGVKTVPTRIKKGDLALMPSIGGGYLMGCVGIVLDRVGAE
jgi:3-oxoacyl-[acyl-carrier-protein] synthase-3